MDATLQHWFAGVCVCATARFSANLAIKAAERIKDLTERYYVTRDIISHRTIRIGTSWSSEHTEDREDDDDLLLDSFPAGTRDSIRNLVSTKEFLLAVSTSEFIIPDRQVYKYRPFVYAVIDDLHRSCFVCVSDDIGVQLDDGVIVDFRGSDLQFKARQIVLNNPWEVIGEVHWGFYPFNNSTVLRLELVTSHVRKSFIVGKVLGCPFPPGIDQHISSYLSTCDLSLRIPRVSVCLKANLDMYFPRGCKSADLTVDYSVWNGSMFANANFECAIAYTTDDVYRVKKCFRDRDVNKRDLLEIPDDPESWDTESEGDNAPCDDFGGYGSG